MYNDFIRFYLKYKQRCTSVTRCHLVRLTHTTLLCPNRELGRDLSIS
uniref:Uncharacterized protein n=1 Tax=Anguilla anguilla TaxID=7936 RepID=A0A0E9Q6E2_ANGAN